VQSARSLADLVEAKSSTATSFLTFRGLISERPAKGYAALLFGAGSPTGDRMAGTVNSLAWSFRAVCVGYSDAQCLFVAEKFDGLFLNWRPVGGSWFSRTPDDPPVIKDDSVAEDVRFSITLRYTLTT
jgi:hypothetical protein